MKRITPKAFYDHIEADKVEFAAGRKRDEEAKRERAALRGSISAVHVRMDSLATKDDIKDMKDAFETAKFGIGFFKFSGRSIVLIGSVMVAIGAIMGGWKLLFAFLFKP